MRMDIKIIVLTLSLCLVPLTVLAQGTSKETEGESLFRINCSVCHPQGGNIFNPQKTLSKKDREANNIKSAQDIVRKMRNPGALATHPDEWSGMKMFDEKAISDKDALEIADYIIETFK